MYDAIVIGGRCAGSPTAMLLARKGYRVLVVDKATFPSDVISTHFLWPHGASYLNRWGLLDEVLRVTPSNTNVVLVNEGIELRGKVPLDLLKQQFELLHGDATALVQTYMGVRRRVLDKVLVDAAGAAGVEVREGCAADGLLMDGDRVVGVSGRTREGTPFQERARIVIGADGRNSFLARALKLPKYDERVKCTFAYWSYFSGFSLGEARILRRGRLSAAIVPTNFGQNMVLIWGPGEWFQSFRHDMKENHQRALEYVSPELGAMVKEQGTREERFYGTPDQAAYMRPLFGPGWVLAGDAGSFKDQCTATGMTHAFRDAELISAAIDAGLSGKQGLDASFEGYERRRRSQSSAAYYDYVCTLAEMKPLRHDELLLFVALRSNQLEADRFIATHADVAPVSDFFTSSNLFQLLEGARESTNDHAIFQRFEAATALYRINPFARHAALAQEMRS
ncbi:MAG TPA: NAD(P)/FAD-dependent oxidoreductase [Polyangiaceae bacterium]|nr:NAD(P)/FAD-dependent oxidoreductase [Polyangiaceae bacterium]